MTEIALQIDNAEKEIEILSLRNQLTEERNEKKQLKQYIEELAKDRNNNVSTTVSFFSPPPDLQVLQQIDSLKVSLLSIKDSIEKSSNPPKSNDSDQIITQQAQEIENLKKSVKQQETLLVQCTKEIESLVNQSSPKQFKFQQRIDLIQQENEENKKLLKMNSSGTDSSQQLRIDTLENQLQEWKKLALAESPIHEMTSLFNPTLTKVIHLTDGPPLSPQAAQFYSSSKSNDKAISELQQQLNNSRKEAKRTAEVATRKCKEFRSLCCKLFGWRVDILDSDKRNVKKCRLHSVFNEEDYLNVEVGRKKCNLTPCKLLESMDGESVAALMDRGGIPRLLLQLYQHLHQQTLE